MRERLANAYPFHPALVDVMRERWAAIPDFQRTRGALRFLAVCLSRTKHTRGAGALDPRVLLGPGDVPLQDPDAYNAFFTEVGQREPFKAVLDADLIGPNARAKRIDERLGRENPALGASRPATRLATAILMYSFGGALKNGGEASEALPPGVTEQELLSACVGPDLDNITAMAMLKHLREQCLFLHYDGVRYVFKTTPNITKLIEDESEPPNVTVGDVQNFIKEDLERRLGTQRAAIVWHDKSGDLADEEPVFLLAYLPLEFAEPATAEQERRALELLTKHGVEPRKYRNGLGLAIPARNQIEPLRRSARYLLAIDRIDKRKKQLGLKDEQIDQLKERRDTERSVFESSMRALYGTIWLAKLDEQGIGIEKIEPEGRPLQATGVHERLMELLTTIRPKVFNTLAPRIIVERLRLGEPTRGGRISRSSGCAAKTCCMHFSAHWGSRA